MSTLATTSSLGYGFFPAPTKSMRDYFRPPDARAGTVTASEQKRRDDIDAILALPQQYREANWNGEGAVPIPELAFQEARAFLQKLPDSFPLPEATPEPDGYLGLEWYANKWLLYVVSFKGNGALSCSGLIGPDRTYGTRYIDESIPAEILRHIAKVIR